MFKHNIIVSCNLTLKMKILYFYFIVSSDFDALPKVAKVILSTVKPFSRSKLSLHPILYLLNVLSQANLMKNDSEKS